MWMFSTLTFNVSFTGVNACKCMIGETCCVFIVARKSNMTFFDV